MENFFENAGKFDENGKYREQVADVLGMERYLKGVFNATECIYAMRLEEKKDEKAKKMPGEDEKKEGEKKKDKKERYEDLIKGVDENWEQFREKKEPVLALEKLYCLVKGNLLLRKGQRKDELFEASTKNYRRAVELLRKHAEQKEKEKKWDTVDLLIQLSLGKYFRNLGHCDKRSNYYIAIHELQKLRQWIEETPGEFDREKTQIWLDVVVNIGRAHKNLYELKEAKRYFWEIVHRVSGKVGDTEKEALQQVRELKIMGEAPGEEVKLCSQAGAKWMYRSYLVQALVQLAIVYRKERDYNNAQGLCWAVRKMDPGNIDARNNLGVCYRKNGKYEEAIAEFEPLKEEGNRFAEIDYWKCVLKKNEAEKKAVFDKEEEFWQFTEKGERDREIRLLTGNALLLKKDPEGALEIFKKLYKNSPYINVGTIGLKSYYCMAKCLMAQEKFQQAKKILQDILSICENDRLAGIDLGWCLMKTDQYVAAREQYEKLLGIARETTWKELEKWDVPSDWVTFEKMKVRNNLGECYLWTKERDKAKVMFNKVLLEENENIEAMGFMAQYYMLEGEEARKQGNREEVRKNYEEAVKKLEEIQCRKGPDAKTDSQLIVVKSAYFRNIAKQKAGESGADENGAAEFKSYMENCLLYYPDRCYMQRACYEMAGYLKEIEAEPESDILYRAFSHIRLWDGEEGFHAFSHLMETQDFLSLNATVRGRILMYLFLIYGNVLRIKEECRCSPDADRKKDMIPRHYTKLNTVKLLIEKPHLRLWNSVYMNDPYEGVSFLDLLMNQSKKEGKELLRKYFPYLNGSEKRLDPVKGNVYITSLTKLEDDMMMWMTYGEGAEGCNIVFADDFFDVRSRLGDSMGLPVYSDEDYPLYEVQYIDEKAAKRGEIKIVTAEEQAGQNGLYGKARKQRDGKLQGKGERIKESMEELWKNVGQLEKYLKTVPEIKASGKDTIRGFIADALNEVRFLFKYDEYAKEQEIRMVRYSSTSKLDKKFEIPRMYVKVKKEMQMKEVMLGPKISPEKTDEIVAWLYATGKVEKVTKSKRHMK